jgi:protein-S-isoprenylcysteine O-methyltransferase Ste14
MLLFAGYCLLCHSAPFAILAVWVCALYYRRRAALEAQVLSEAFGADYDAYRARTPKQFVPWVA